MTRKKTSYNRKRSKNIRNKKKGGANALVASEPENNLLGEISRNLEQENNDRNVQIGELRNQITEYLNDINNIRDELLQHYYKKHDEVETLFGYLQAFSAGAGMGAGRVTEVMGGEHLSQNGHGAIGLVLDWIEFRLDWVELA